VVRLGAIGDVVRTLPAVSSLRAGYPGAHIAWLVEPRAASAVQGQPWVDEMIVFGRPELVALLKGGSFRAAAREFIRFATALRRRRFELVVDFHSLLRSALLAWLSGARRRVGYARPFGRELSYCFATHRARLSPARMSRFERNAALVRYLGIDATPSPTPLRVAPHALARMEAALGPGRRPVALHPGSGALRTAGACAARGGRHSQRRHLGTRAG
jgi:ADP-heptose:LPS heptosyltransferase